MMRCCVLLILVMAISLSSQTSDSDSIDFSQLMKKKPAHWWDISYGCSELAPTLFAQGDQDSLMNLLQFWEEHTNYYEPIRRLWMLMQINDNTFDASFISPAIVDDMYAYEFRAKSKKDSSDWYLWSNDKTTAMISASFNVFTKNFAQELLQFDDLSDDEWLICLFYSDNFDAFWKAFEDSDMRHTRLYNHFYREYKDATEFNLQYYAFGGWYSPRKNLAALGGKLKLGFSVGLEYERLLIDGTFAIRALNPKEPYTVGYNNELFETNDYVGVYIGLEPSFNLYQIGPARIDLLSGVALDMIQAIPEEKNPYEEESVDMATANLNLGIGARLYLSKKKPYCVRLQLRYEFASFDSHGGTDLSEGEALTFRIGFGWAEDSRKYKQKKYFD